VPFADLFPWRGFARKIFDGSQTNAPTFHGTLVDADYANKYPEVVVAYLRAAIEADRLVSADPEGYSELIAKTTGIEPEVDYLFHGPLGLQTRDYTWKPEYRQAVVTALHTLKLLKKVDSEIDVSSFVDDRFIRAAAKASGIDYDKRLHDYAPTPLVAKDTLTGEEIKDPAHVAQIWLRDEAHVRSYATIAHAFDALADLQRRGKEPLIVYAQDRERGIKLIAAQAWFVREPDGVLDAFLLKGEAQTWADAHKGSVLSFAAARAAAAAPVKQTSAQ
jgi:NitT/TauT family transport system substrate-binding protein